MVLRLRLLVSKMNLMFRVQSSENIFSNRFQRLAGEAFWVGLGQAAAALGGLIGVRFLTHALSPTSYGELALGMTVATLTQQAVLGPLSAAFLRFFAPAREANRLPAYLWGVWKLLLQATLVLIVVAGLLCLGLWASGHVNWLGLVLAAFLYSLLSGYNSALDGMQNAARQRPVVAWHQGLGQWLRPLAAVALVAALGSYSTVAMLGYVLASMCVLASQLVFFQRKILGPFRHMPVQGRAGGWTRQVREYAWPFATWGLFTWVQSSSDRWALQTFGVTSDVGFYAVLYQLGYYPITLLSGMMIQLIEPVLFSRAGDGTDAGRMAHARRLNNLLVAGTMLLTLLATTLAFLLHSWLFSWLVAPQYRGVSMFLPWMVLSGGLFTSGQVATLSLMTGIKTRSLIAPKILTALLGILLNFAGAVWLGLPGVVCAGLVFSFCYFAWVLCQTHVASQHSGVKAS